MKTISKAFRVAGGLCLFLMIHSSCFGIEDTNVIALTGWSEPSDSIRGRLGIVEGYSPAYGGNTPETKVYVELQNVSARTSELIDVHFDMNALKVELRDKNNRPPPPVGTGGSGGYPSANWVTLPYDSTIRLRASWYGYGMTKDKGLMIPLATPIILRADNTNDYFLSGTFTASSPTNHVANPDHRVWHGSLTFPPVKVSGRRP